MAEKPKRGSTPHRKFRTRAARVRRRPWLLGALIAGVLAIVGGLVYLFGYSSVLEVEDVRVEHAEEGQELSEEFAAQILDQAAVRTGVPLARVDTAAATARVAADLRIAEVSVRRSWPNAVTVVVSPREPALVVNQVGEPARVADADGVIFDPVGDISEDLVELRMSRGEPDAERVAGVLRMVNSFDPAWSDQVEEARLLSDGRLRFDLGELRVEWGLPEREDEKARILTALLEQDAIDPDNTEADITINLLAPDSPVVRGLPEVFEE